MLVIPSNTRLQSSNASAIFLTFKMFARLVLSLASLTAIFGGALQAGAQTPTLIMTVTSGGSVVTTVPLGTVVTLTVTSTSGASGEVDFCNAAIANVCTGIGLLGTAQLAAGQPAVLTFVPGPGPGNYFAALVETPTGFSAISSISSLLVTATRSGKPLTSAAIARSGNAGDYTLTATTVGYVSSTGLDAPTGTVSFLDTSNAGAVLGTAQLEAGTAEANWSFAEALPTDSEPQGVAVADFNGDGNLDIVVANLFGDTVGGGTVDVYLGNGDGTFSARTIIPVGAFPPGVAVGNFGGSNGDLVVTNGLVASPEASFFLNDGHGNFSQGPNTALPGIPAQIAVALDGSYLAAPSGTTTGMVSFLSKASDFALVQSVPVGNSPDGIVAMNFGVVVTQFLDPGSITVITGALGSFKVSATLPTGNGPIGIAAGDFKMSGSVRDLAVANNDDNTVSIFFGDGSGGFTAGPVVPVGQGPFGVTVGDFNGDGKADIAVANKTDNTVTILLGNGDGTFTAGPVLSVGNAPALLAAGDFNGDGSPDFVVTNTSDSTASVFLTQITRTATATASGIAVAGTGTHQVEASYPGDTNYAASVSATIGLTATQQLATTTTTVTSNHNPAQVGQSVTFTATVSSTTAGTPTGMITFKDGTNTLGTGTVAAGAATFATSSLALGSHSITAVYGGDANFSGSTSAALTEVISSATSAPTLTSLTPNSATAGGASFMLTATGTNFASTSTLKWNGVALVTTFGSATQLTVAVPASDIATAGTASVTVFTPAPGGGTSGALTFTINAAANNPVPTLTALQPSSATAGGAAFTLTVTGTNFINTSTVKWNGVALTTTPGSATQLTAAVPASDIATAGTASVTVFNGTPGGGTSGALTFTISAAGNPVPTLTGLQPSTVSAGTAVSLMVTGTNFISTSVVKLNGTALATTFTSATQLMASASATAIATTGTPSVTVFNPAPGGGSSSGLTLTIVGFSIPTTPGPQTVMAGQPANFTIPTAPAGAGPAATLAFSASGLPTGTVATFNPSSVTAGTSTILMVTTTARTNSATTHEKFDPPGNGRPAPFPAGVASLALAMMLAGLSFMGFVRKPLRRFAPTAALILLVVTVGYLAACASSSSKGNPNGTPAGMYTITVKVTSPTGALSTNVTLVVQ